MRRTSSARFGQPATHTHTQCLKKDPAERIKDADIKSHPWFAGLDWDKLLKKEIPAPWKPDVKGAEDTSNIDEEFINEDVTQMTPTEAPDAADAFVGFTFQDPSTLNQDIN